MQQKWILSNSKRDGLQSLTVCNLSRSAILYNLQLLCDLQSYATLCDLRFAILCNLFLKSFIILHDRLNQLVRQIMSASVFVH